MSQAWTAFHRLHTLLKHSAVPIQRRVQLWSMCVWSITRYGLSSVGLDDVCTQQLVQHVYRQLRMVARSPAHISHETSAALLHRLGLQHPVDQLAQLTAKRIELSRPHVSHLQPPGVQQWWGLVLASFRVNQPTPSTGSQLIEVTQLLRARFHCPQCGQTFPSHHALQVHIGKSHKKPTPTSPTQDPKPCYQRRNDERFRIHALNGLPTCRHCHRSFHGWPEFSGHFRGSACPVLHAAPDSTAPRCSLPILAKGASVPEEGTERGQEPTPLFHRPDLQLLAKRNQVRQLATAIYNSGRLNFCPECGQWCTHPKYLSRHANKIHPHLAQHHALIQRWARSKNRASQPCEWCQAAYKTRPLTHLQSCPVLWICGHMIHQHSSLADTGQLQLSDAFRYGHCPDGSPGPGGTSAGTGGTGAVQPVHAGQERAGPEPVVDSPHGHTAALDCSGTITGGDGGGQGQTPRQPAARTGPATRQVGKGRGKRGQERQHGPAAPDGQRDLRRAFAESSSGLRGDRDYAVATVSVEGRLFQSSTGRGQEGGQAGGRGPDTEPPAGKTLPKLGQLGPRRQGPQRSLEPRPLARPQPPRRRGQQGPARSGSRRGDGEPSRDGSKPGEIGPPVGGLHGDQQLGQRVPDVLSDQHALGSYQPAVQSSHRVEGPEGNGPLQPHATDAQYAILLRLGKPSGPASANGGPPGSGVHQRGESPRPHGGQHMGVSEMGQQGEETCEGHPGAIGARHGGAKWFSRSCCFAPTRTP